MNVALAYHEAWTSKDLDRAMSYVSEDVICEAPAGRIEGGDAYRAFVAPFVQMLVGSKMIAAFGDAETALVMYDTETAPVKSAPGAECITVHDGKITHSRFILTGSRSKAPAEHRADSVRGGGRIAAPTSAVDKSKEGRGQLRGVDA